MRRPAVAWAVYALCCVLALAAMSWLSVKTLAVARRDAEAQARTAHEERVRLALWRMDSSLARLIAQESARPAGDYSVASKPVLGELEGGGLAEVRIPSPLRDGPPADVHLHFELGPDGRLVSPAEASERHGQLAAARLRALGPALDLSALLEQLARQQPRQLATSWSASDVGDDPLRTLLAQNRVEYSKRQAVQVQNSAPALSAQPRSPSARGRDVSAMTPLWRGEHLLLARSVLREAGASVQGAWLDWDALRQRLLGEIRDLLPNASLHPVDDPAAAEPDRLLASLPVRLEAGESVARLEAAPEITRALAFAWAGLLLAMAAFAALLFGALSLSERRAAFVSAVTHELRTPLTTFRLYSGMLAGGMVEEEAKRQSYYATLQKEAERLAHLVENVLAYARLEKRAPRPARPVGLAELLRQNRARAEERAMEADARLELAPPPDSVVVLADPPAVEQILFNLVDNACKYGRSGDDPLIRIGAELRGAFAAVHVADSGPGLDAAASKWLFQPFSRSAERAAGSAPGVGLGLAISRRLARSMGGDLRYERPEAGGARFVLLLRTAPPDLG